MDILIFWSLNIVRLKISCVSELFKSGMTAPPKLQPARTEFSDNLPNTTEQLRHPRTSINVSQTNLDTPLTPPSGLRHQQTAAHITRHWQTLSDTPQCRGVWRGVCVVSRWYFGMSEVLKYVQRCVSKLNPNGNELEGSNYIVKAWLWNAWFFHLTILRYQNIKMSIHICFQNMIEFCYFLKTLCSPERNYKTQLF